MAGKKTLPQAPTVPIQHDSRGEGAGGGSRDATAHLQAANQKAMHTGREAQASGVFGAADGDVSRAGIRQLSPAEFVSIAPPKTPPRPEVSVPQTTPKNPISKIVEKG